MVVVVSASRTSPATRSASSFHVYAASSARDSAGGCPSQATMPSPHDGRAQQLWLSARARLHGHALSAFDEHVTNLRPEIQQTLIDGVLRQLGGDACSYLLNELSYHLPAGTFDPSTDADGNALVVSAALGAEFGKWPLDAAAKRVLAEVPETAAMMALWQTSRLAKAADYSRS